MAAALMTIELPAGERVVVDVEPLTAEAFAPFGSVVQNPRPDLHPLAVGRDADDGGGTTATGTGTGKATGTRISNDTAAGMGQAKLPPNAVSANQGTAIQYRNASLVSNLYARAPSGGPGEPVMSVFVCAARVLEAAKERREGKGGGSGRPELAVRYLERHPFTTQTFSPLASSATEYLVVVAPSLSPSLRDEGLPVPSEDPRASSSPIITDIITNPAAAATSSSAKNDGSNVTANKGSYAEGPWKLPGRGLPDVRRLRAFAATAAQAVTYGAGTWHAPMVVLGGPGQALSFAVWQFASGVGVEDCQLVEVAAEPGVAVRMPRMRGTREKL